MKRAGQSDAVANESGVCGGVLDVGHHGGSLGSGSLLRPDLVELGGLQGKLLLVDFVLLAAGSLLLLLGLALGDLLHEELVQALLLVGELARDQQHDAEDHGEDEGAEGVPGECVRVDDAEAEDAPPVQGLEDPEADQGEDDAGDVGVVVLVDALVVRLVDGVVAVAVALERRLVALRGVRSDAVLHLLTNKLIITRA